MFYAIHWFSSLVLSFYFTFLTNFCYQNKLNVILWPGQRQPPGYRHKITFSFTCLTILWALMCQNGQHITEVWYGNCMAAPLRNCHIYETSCMNNYVEIFPSTNLNFFNPIPSFLIITRGKRSRELSRKQSLHSTQKINVSSHCLKFLIIKTKSHTYTFYNAGVTC